MNSSLADEIEERIEQNRGLGNREIEEQRRVRKTQELEENWEKM